MFVAYIVRSLLMSDTSRFIWNSRRGPDRDHDGLVVWFTGLSGAGKTTLARALQQSLLERELRVHVLDGDDVRKSFSSRLGFDLKSRSENVRRIGELAATFVDAGVIVLVACISPMRADRDRIRSIHAPGSFLEIYVNAPLSVCEKRDPKGLYVGARANLIKDFTGISSPYEPPPHPDLELHTDKLDVGACVERLLLLIEERLFKEPAEIHA